MKVDDDDLLNRQFWTQNPKSLDGLIDYLPDSLEIPVIEYQYDLRRPDHEENIKVKCVHCKVSAPNHSKGFVLKLPSTGERFLIGKDCGKRHYAAHFEQVSREFREQLKRSLQLNRLKNIQSAFPSFLRYLDDIVEHPTFVAYDDLHVKIITNFPDLQRALAQSTGELTIPEKVRDIAREEREAQKYEAEQGEWDNLTTTEKKKRRRDGIKPPEPKKYYVTQNKVSGRFSGREFIVWQRSIVEEIAQISEHLKRMHRQIVGLKTNDLKTKQLSTTLNLVSSLANEIEEVMGKLRAMTAFFQPANLATIANWANQNPNFQEKYSSSGYRLISEDSRYGMQKYTVALPHPVPSSPDVTGLHDFIEQAKLAK